MEVERIISSMDCASKDDDDVPLPGFRFHPTDEELVGFYLRRKVEKRPISIELIKQVDIYKYDPWDLPKASNVGDKEWYFFCKRGRKYRNSIRPNRVTSSGFWKATGIDRPIYNSEGRECIGLKKSLVYYRGSAGKGTKTDWMMHEFRLPADHDDKSTKHVEVKNIVSTQEAEVWTLCRILKRSVSQRKCMPDWKEASAKRNNNINAVDASSKTCSVDSDSHESKNYIDFRSAPAILQDEKKQFVSNHFVDANHQMLVSQLNSRSSSHQAPIPTSYSSGFFSPEMNDFIKYGDWDELRSVLEFAVDSIPYVNNM